MSAKRILVTVLVAVSILMVGAASAYAQDDTIPGNGYGNQPWGGQTGQGSYGSRAGRGQGRGMQIYNYAASGAPAGALTPEVADALAEAIADEQRAYAFYGALIEQFGPVAPFVQIQSAEAAHRAALERLFERYGVTVPEAPTVEAPAVSSWAEACALGAQIESANESMYVELIAAAQGYPDVVQVFTNLRDASLYKHLPALENCAQ